MKVVATLLLATVVSVAAATSTAATTHLQPGVAKLTWTQTHELKTSGEWHSGCPVARRDLRVLTVRYYGFDHGTHLGQIVVNKAVTTPLTTAFAKLYKMRFPIRKMSFEAAYGQHQDWSDLTASFECRQAAASPCTGGRTGTWSMHAYGEAVDLNPRENPYVGCGMSRDKTARSYMRRSDVRPGMAIRPTWRKSFAKVGWGWGGTWQGSTKDYMHFSINGH
ncbi:MAG TPA: M15 family metallopeptidase [Gaiellaceae bacterium]